MEAKRLFRCEKGCYKINSVVTFLNLLGNIEAIWSRFGGGAAKSPMDKCLKSNTPRANKPIPKSSKVNKWGRGGLGIQVELQKCHHIIQPLLTFHFNNCNFNFNKFVTLKILSLSIIVYYMQIKM